MTSGGKVLRVRLPYYSGCSTPISMLAAQTRLKEVFFKKETELEGHGVGLGKGEGVDGE